MQIKSLALAAALGLAAATTSQAAVVQITEGAFQPTAGLITFSEYAVGTNNPTYTPAQYGGDAGSPNVATGGWFQGQSLSLSPGADCPGAAATACVVGNPTGPLTLDLFSPTTFITSDGANPTSPVLSGSPIFNGGIALLFSIDQVAVGFTAGFFDAIGSTGITAFARDGSLLGTVVNSITGIEFLGLATDDGQAEIAGVFLDLVGNEPAGFAVDNIRFGQADDVVLPPDPNVVPLPAAGWLMLAGLAGIAGLRRRNRA